MHQRFVLGRGRQMEAADDRVNFLDPGHLLRLTDRVDPARVAARRDDDEATVLHVIDGRAPPRRCQRRGHPASPRPSSHRSGPRCMRNPSARSIGPVMSQHSCPAPGTGDRNARRPNLAVRPRPPSRGPTPPLVQDRLQETQPTAAPGAYHAWLGVAALALAQWMRCSHGSRTRRASWPGSNS